MVESSDGKLLRLNPAKAKLKAGGVLVAFGLTTPSVGAAQVLARAGADVLIADMEHGSIDLQDTQNLMAADLGRNCVCIVRVPSRTPHVIKPVLDAGAFGLTFPMIKSGADLSEAIAQAQYFPQGNRAHGAHTAPARWGMSLAEYIKDANDGLLFNTLIETREAVNDVEAIVGVKGIDVITIGLGDLCASLGHPGDAAHPEVQEAIAHIEHYVLKSTVALGGIITSPEDMIKKRERRYRVLVAGFDVSLLSSAAVQLVNTIRN